MSHVAFFYHIVWRTKCSEMTINPDHERLLYAYIHSMCKARDCKLYRINSMPDHVHMLVSISPKIAISDFMMVIKSETSKWMLSCPDKFPHFRGWGNGYAGFSYSLKDLDMIIAYIKNQKEHHRVKTFKEEYYDFLKENGMDIEHDLFLKD